jgi:hypothetical protein
MILEKEKYMGTKYKYKFKIKHDKAWAWHVGVFFCVEPRCDDGKRDFYLFLCFGNHDITIGMIHDDCSEDTY